MDDFSDLEALLKSAKKEAHFRRQEIAQRKALTPKFGIKKQAEMEWKVGQTVCLIHRSEDGTETALGLFTEYLRNGSRWLRPSADTLTPHHSEIVTGSWWLNPCIREIPVSDSPSEVKAIRSRFEMLINEFSEELGLPPLVLSERPFEEDEDDDWVEDEDDEDFDYDEDEEEE